MGYRSDASFGAPEDCFPVEPLRDAILEFRSKWFLNNKELAKMWNVPPQTIQGILVVGKKSHVKPVTAERILDGIKNYDPRRCNYRRIPKDDAERIFIQMKNKSGLTWRELASVIGARPNVLWDMVTPTSQRKYIPINDMREFLQNFKDWDVEHSRKLISEGVA